jgi:RND family efflux transporter MFP subunit
MKNRLILALTICLLTTSCGHQSSTDASGGVEVKTERVHRSDVPARQSYSGTIEESEGSTLSFSIAGTVRSVAVRLGQQVRRGDLIATLDDTNFRQSYEVASATLDQCQDAYDRMKQLHDAGSLPEVQWVEAESRLRQAQATFEMARKNLRDVELRAPFAGFVAEKSADVGNNVVPGMAIAKLMTLDNIKVCVSVPESEICSINIGNEIEIQVPALNAQTFCGQICEKGVAANPVSRTYEVKAQVANPEGRLLPGMLCTLTLQQPDAERQAFLLPRHVVQLNSDNRYFVWVNDGGQAARRYVTPAGFVGDEMVITAGLNENDELIVEGQQKVSEGMDLIIIR